MSGPGDIYSLGLSIDPTGTVDPLRQIQTELDKTADAGVSAGQKLGQGFSDAVKGKAVTAAKEMMQQFENQFNADQARIAEGLARGFLTPAQAQAAGREAAIQYNQGLLSQLDQLGSSAGLDAGNSKTYRSLADSLKDVDTSSSNAGVGLGRLGQSLVSAADRAAGFSPVVGRLSYALGALSLGTMTTVGIFAGFAALALAYDAVTGSSKQLEEQNKASLKTVQDLANAYSQTEYTKGQAALAAQQQVVDQAKANLAAAQDAATGPGYGAGKGVGNVDPLNIQRLQANVAAAEQVLKDAQARLGQLEQQAAQAEDKLLVDHLATIVASGHATAAQIQQVQTLLAGYTQTLNGLQNQYAQNGATPFANPTTIAATIDTIHTLQGALDKYTESLKGPVSGIQEMIREADLQRSSTQQQTDALTKQIGEWQRLDLENDKQEYNTQRQIEAIGLQGSALKDFNAQTDAELQRMDARSKLSGIALTDRLNEINAEEDLAHKKTAMIDLWQLETDRIKLNADATVEATKNAEANAKATQAVFDAQNKAAAQLGNEFAKDLNTAIDTFAAHGITSFKQLFDEAGRFGIQMLDQLDAKWKELGPAASVTPVPGGGGLTYGDLAQLSVGVSAVFAGGSTGYALGQQTNSPFNGAGVGGVVGGVQGYQLGAGVGLGPEGAIIGALAGAIGGLLGAAAAHKQAAAELEKAGEQIETSLAAYGSGGNSTLSALVQNNAQFQQIVSSITGWLGQAIGQSGGNKGSINSAFGQANSEYQQAQQEQADNAKRIIQQFLDGVTQGLNATEGPFGAFQNSLDAAKKQFLDDEATALATGQSVDTLNQISQRYINTVNQLTAAYNENQAQTQYSLDARQASAKGDSAVADAITRRAAEEKELFDAQTNGYTDAQIAQLKYIQGLEDELAAKKALQTANESLASSAAAGPGGTLSQQQAAALQPLLDKYADDLENYNAAVEAGLDPMTQLALQTQVAADAAAIAAQEFQDAVAALQQADADIEDAVSGGYLTGDQGLAQERSGIAGLAGVDASTLSDAVIRSLYTIPQQGQELTDQQRALNKAIDQYFADEQKWGSSTASSTSALASAVTGSGGAASIQTTAVSSAASQLTSQEGNRIGDLLEAQLIVERELLAAVISGSPLGGAYVGPTVNPFGATPAFPTPGASNVNGGGVTLNVNIAVKDGRSPAQLAQDIADQVQVVLAQRYLAVQRRLGLNTAIGQ